jgi:HSP20 family protein
MSLITKPRSGIKPEVYNSLLDRFFPNGLSEFWNRPLIETVPAVNIREKKDGFQIEMAAPGLKKSDFKIDADDNLITVACEKESEEKTEEKDFTKREYNYSAFSRSFTVPETADANKITARYEDGVLKLAVPKKEKALKPAGRSIKVS